MMYESDRNNAVQKSANLLGTWKLNPTLLFQSSQRTKISMSLKLKAPSDLFFEKLYKDPETSELEDASQDQTPMKKKRAPACLNIQCPVCGGPAPDHVHFGGNVAILL